MAEAVQRSLEEQTKGAGTVAAPAVPPAPPAPPKKLQARFVSDVTIPDGTVLQPGESFVKTWKLRNCGPTWPESVHFMHVGGDMIHTAGGSKVQVPLPRAVGKGEEIDLTVEMKAPMKPGRYVTYWRLINKATSVRFGHRVWTDITVELPPKAAPAPQPVATPVVLPAVTVPAEDQAEVSSISQEAALAVSAQLQQETQSDQQGDQRFVMVDAAPEAKPGNDCAAATAEAATEAEAPPAPAPTPAPAATPDAASEPYQVQLQMLAEMGFFDRDRLIPLLQNNNGDVQRVLEQVL